MKTLLCAFGLAAGFAAGWLLKGKISPFVIRVESLARSLRSMVVAVREKL